MTRILREMALGYPYLEKKRILRRTEFGSHKSLQELQESLLLKVLRHAARSVPFYQEYVDADRLKCLVDVHDVLAVFPLIDKNIIRTRLNDFLSGSDFRRLKATSGGSTGEPFLFYMDRLTTRQREKAFIFDQWGRVGYRLGDSIFNLRGRTPEKGRFVQHDRLFNIYFVSSFDLSITTVGEYVSCMNTIRPRFLHGYPSTIYQLALLVEASRKHFTFRPRAVFCGSEKLFPFQREKIEAIFNCRVYHWYGHSECLVLGGACENTDTLHIYPQYGFTELLPTEVFDDQGRRIFEIVATGFNNAVMPLVRYRTGDYAVPASVQSCSCGRNYLLIDEIIGRQQEFIVDRLGSLISATSLVFGQHYEAFDGLQSIKINQQRPGSIDVILVKGVGFREDLCRKMATRMEELIGDRMAIRFLFAESSEKTAIGKAKLVNQELDIREYLPSC